MVCCRTSWPTGEVCRGQLGGHTRDDEEHGHGQVHAHVQLGVKLGLDGGEDEPLVHQRTGLSSVRLGPLCRGTGEP